MKFAFRINFQVSILSVLMFLYSQSSQVCAQSVSIIQWTEAESYWKNQHPDTFLVVNFWASWCKPCVTELPYFEELRNATFSKPVKVLLVNLDYVEDLNNRVIPILKKRNIQTEVWLLNETNPNQWIDKVDKNWSGAIPATLFVDAEGQYKAFKEKVFSSPELLDLVRNLSK
jgi:thiol-disulfide isomerase/thioredoxin